MAIRPEKSGSPNYYEWASSDVTYVVHIGGTGQVIDNKVEPLEEFTTFGLKYGQPIDFNQLNYQFDGVSRWIQHLDQRLSTGSIHRTTINHLSADPVNEQLGGVWVKIGEQIVNGTTTYLWEKQS